MIEDELASIATVNTIDYVSKFEGGDIFCFISVLSPSVEVDKVKHRMA